MVGHSLLFGDFDDIMMVEVLMGVFVGPPEYPGRSKDPVPQTIDIWSLACVFSLAATWIICDYAGIDLFHKVRQRAVSKTAQSQPMQPSPQQHDTEFQGDQFHDGREVLDAVTEWHKYLRDVARRTDTITTKVLDLVDEHMLVADPESRINAKDLCSKLDKISESYLCPSEHRLPETIRTLLGEIDEEESRHAARTRRSRIFMQEKDIPCKTDSRNLRKPTRAERPLVTAHRQSIWPNQDLRFRDGLYPEKQGLELQPIEERSPSPKDSPETVLQTPKKIHRYSSSSIMSKSLTYAQRSDSPKKHPSRDYFQACDELERRKQDMGLRKLLPRKDNVPDRLLSAYFAGNRDIVSSNCRVNGYLLTPRSSDFSSR